MAYIDQLTALLGANVLDTDIIYIGRPGDPDPDRRILVPQAAIALLARAPDGSAGTPGIRFAADPDTGIFRPGANIVGIGAGGGERLRVETAQVRPLVPVRGNDGTAGAPVFSFNGDPDTGMYSDAANVVTLSAGGTGRLRARSTAPFAEVNDGTWREAWHAGNLPFEEGTWTPVLGGGGGDPSSVTYGTRWGRYQRIGGWVTVNGSMTVVSYAGGSGALRLGGLPFNGRDTEDWGMNIGSSSQVTVNAAAVQWNPRVFGGGSRLRFWETRSAANVVEIQLSAVPTGTAFSLAVNGTYPI